MSKFAFVLPGPDRAASPSDETLIRQISREHAEIVDLVYYQEKSIREIVEILGIPANTVKTRMFYARKRLAALVATAGIERAAA